MTTFVRVVQAGSLAAAARSLRLTPAAVSRQLSGLEAELGVPLLVRTTRQLSMTDEGRRFFEHAERTCRSADAARASVRVDHAVEGRVTISAPTAMGPSGLDVSLAALLSAHPGLRVDLRLEDHSVDLVAEAVDVAIRAGLPRPDSASLVSFPIADVERIVVAAPSYLRSRGEPPHPSDLKRHDALVHLHDGSGVGVWVFEHERAASLSVEVAGPLRANAFHTLRTAAVTCVGIAVLPGFVVAEDLDKKRLRILALGGYRPARQSVYALVRTETKDLPRVRAFLHHAREQLGTRLKKTAAGLPSASAKKRP